ncbi:uncharacterized protein LOC112341900 isoform X3 [Selaginella moellendorffii]|uniref:uncharacterized protein LOC112341900 isoform X3 n=1 Tax=Selaginella moellendorffii TaxID=88036 RepID=UPI000D1C395E|nr:uncharacterized protein LOC112341900 isoform X3 [Selaginella moellendorffii]|eukprot:XP_024518660.1 uncharacterized protein LOC112341900 isoform X3 [Selaginella moellendorffii]
MEEELHNAASDAGGALPLDNDGTQNSESTSTDVWENLREIFQDIDSQSSSVESKALLKKPIMHLRRLLEVHSMIRKTSPRLVLENQRRFLLTGCNRACSTIRPNRDKHRRRFCGSSIRHDHQKHSLRR